MAINNGRYVVTGGYIDPNGNVIEETKYVPEKTYSPDHILSQVNSLLNGTKTAGQIRMEDNIYGSPTTSATPSSIPASADLPTRTFSPAETYALQAQGYANAGDNAMATAYGDLANSLGKYSQYANTTLGAYDNLLNYIAGNEGKLQSAAGKLYNELSSDISRQRDYVNRMFGPEGELTQEVNKYYDDLGNYLATDAGRQAANIAAQGVHSGASLGSIRAQQNEAYNESFARYIQAKEQQINAKQQIASNLINFMSTLRKEYGDTTNQYIIELYKRANDLYNNVALSAAQDLDSYNKLRLSASGGGSSSTLNDILKSIGLVDKDGNPTDNGDGIIKGQGDGTSEGTDTDSNKSKLGNGSRSAGGNSSNVDWVNVFNAMLNPVGFWGAELGKGIGGLIK